MLRRTNPATGGAETYAKVVASELAARGHEITVITDGARIPGADAETDGGVAVRRLRAYQELLADPTKLPWEQMYFGLLPELSDVLATHASPDALLANSHESAVLAVVLAAELGGVPVFATYHQQDRERGPVGVGRSRFAYGLLPLAGVLAGSRYYYAKAEAFGTPPGNLHLVPHGVDVEQFTGACRPRSPDGFHIVLAGRIAPRKGQAFMVEVASGLRDAGVPVWLTLAGRAHSSTKEYAAKVDETIRRLGVVDCVERREDLAHSDMPELYRTADLVSQPSTEEGLGLAVLEAMACGAPVAVSDTFGLKEIITDRSIGLRLPVNDLDAWVTAIAALAREDDRRITMAAAGQGHVRRCFDQTTMIDATEAILAAAVSRTRRDRVTPLSTKADQR